LPDIDIDFADRNNALNKIKHIPAAIVDKDGTFKKHNTGVYCTSIPYNPLTGTASIDYKTAEERGYFKIDFLNVSLYQQVVSEEHLTRLVKTEPLWDLLEQRDFSDLLFHVNGHHSILAQMKPKNILQLAAVLAMIRPAKRYLIGKSWYEVMTEVWIKPESDEYFFKKAHAVAYAHAIVVQMNLICEVISYEYS
jgi:Fe-S cluster assembly iron-binding protein IscA